MPQYFKGSPCPSPKLVNIPASGDSLNLKYPGKLSHPPIIRMTALAGGRTDSEHSKRLRNPSPPMRVPGSSCTVPRDFSLLAAHVHLSTKPEALVYTTMSSSAVDDDVRITMWWIDLAVGCLVCTSFFQ